VASGRDLGFGTLDYLYTPSRDVAADVAYFADVLGAEIVFAIEAMGTRVAMVRLGDEPPAILLTDHLEGERAILVYRVADLAAALDALAARGWAREETLELPPGPACSFRTPGGHRIAVYEPTRPQVVGSFNGRRDF
jgi:catechol 2,3-dioxygenase-like lactoylglutathione lyase family enzyme